MSFAGLPVFFYRHNATEKSNLVHHVESCPKSNA
jgi:hypothetical protein